MQTIGDNQPIDLDRLRKVEEFFSQHDTSNQRANKNRSIEIEDLDDSDVLEEWLRKKQAGTNLDPIKQRVPLQESPQSDYLIELTRLREPDTPSSLSNLTIPDVNISLINSVASTPGQPRRSAALTPRRSSGLHHTPRVLLQQKQIEEIEKANQQRRQSKERFNPTASSTPCRQSLGNNFLSKLSLGRQGNNEVNVNRISSSDEPSPLQVNATNGNKETSENNINESNKSAVEPVSTSQNDKTLAPCTQEQPNEMQSNEDEEIIPESQDTEEEPIIRNPVQAPVNNSLRGSQQQQMNQQQVESNGMRTPPNSAKGVPPSWAQTILSTPKSAKNQTTRLPFLRKTPQTDTVDKRSNLAAQEIAQSNVLESTPTKSNRNSSFGKTLVVAVTNSSALPATSTLTMPSIQLNVNINGAMPQSPNFNGTADNDGTISKTVELDRQPSENNGSNESIMTNDSDPLSDEVDKANNGIERPRLDHTDNMSARRQLVQSFRATEVENSPVRQPIDNLTHTINNESTYKTIQRKSKRSTTRSTFSVDYTQSNGSNILPPIDSRTFDKQQSNVGDATYDISKHGTTTHVSMSTFTKDVHNVSRRRNTIDVPDVPPLKADVVDLTFDSAESSYDTDDADTEVARVTGPPEINASNGSSNHCPVSIDPDEGLELLEGSDHQRGTQTEGTQIQIEEKIAEKIQNEIQNGKTPSAFNPVVVLKQLPADISGQCRKSTNGTQQPINIRESESFSHMVPPFEFRDEPIVRDRTPESAIREFSIEQTRTVNPPSTSHSKRRKKSVNPELEAVNETYKEIHRQRSSSPKRAPKVRKLFTHQNEDDDLVGNLSKNSEASTSTSMSTAKDNAQDDVFKKPLTPAIKRSRISLHLSKTSSANQSSNATIISQTDPEQSATNSTHSESTDRPIEKECAEQMNVDEPVELETDQVQQSSKRPKRKTKTMSKAKEKPSARCAIAVNLSNLIKDGDDTASSGRTKRLQIKSYRTQCMETLNMYYNNKRKLSHASSTTTAHKRPKLSENQSSRSKSSEYQPSRSKSSENHSSRSKSSGNHSRPTSEELFKQSLTEHMKNVLQQSWWKNLCDMSEKRKINRNMDEADLNIRKVPEGKRVESVSLDSLEFQQISDGFDIGIIPSERYETRTRGFIRLKPSATKEKASAENDTHFYIFNGEIVLNADTKKWELIGGDTFLVRAGIDYEIQNVGTDVCILSFIINKD